MTVSNISSKATGPNVKQIPVEPPGAEGMKISTNRQGHITNMATMPMYGKPFRNLLLNHGQTLLYVDAYVPAVSDTRSATR